MRALIHLLLLTLVPFHFLAAQNTEFTTETAIIRNGYKRDDTARKFLVERIIIAGAKKTKEHIIRREIHFAEGDSINAIELNDEIQLARQQIYNTNLFNEVKLEVTQSGPERITVLVLLRERWYILPIPVVQLVDRNLNEWIKLYNADLNRLIYGIRFNHYNLTGRRDQLRITALNGFTRQLSVSYTNPFINKKLTLGINVGAGLTYNKTFIYKTDSLNKALFFKGNDYARQNYFLNAALILRKNIRNIHTFSISFNHIQVVDSVLKDPYNSDYFRAPSDYINLIDISYGFQYVNVNNVAYPLNGTTASLLLTRRGLGFSSEMDMTTLEGGYNRYFPLNKNFFLSIQSYGKLTVPFDQPYLNRRAMGYGDFYLHGLELKVIDGVASALTSLALKKKIWSVRLPSPFGKEKERGVPLSLFVKTYVNAGYIYTMERYRALLNNMFLYSGGLGIDLLTLYDINLRVEYSFNQLGQKGLFLRMGLGLQIQ